MTWDSYDAYLFDIDGTLIECQDAVHYFGFCEVLTSVAGRAMNLDGVVAHGNVDAGILRDALQHAGVAEEHWRPKLSGLCDDLGSFVERRAKELRIKVLPGANAVLDHLRSKGAAIGVATGNLERIGWAKLQSCGLRQHIDFGGFSDGYEWRPEVLAEAARTARSLAGSRATICVLGDTPADVAAAKANGLDVIAVATGVYSREELSACAPNLLVNSLAELLGLPHAESGLTAL